MINVPMKTSEPLNRNTISSLGQNKVKDAYTRQSIANINNSVTNNNRNTGSNTVNNATNNRNTGSNTVNNATNNRNTGSNTVNNATNNRSTGFNTVNNVTSNNRTNTGTTNNVRTNNTMSSSGYGATNTNTRTNTNSHAQSTVQQAPPAIADKPIPPLRKPTRKGQKVALEGVGRQSKLKVCLGWNVNNSQCDVDVSAFLLGGSGKVIGDEWFVFYGQTKSPDGSVCFYEDNGPDREYITIDFNKLNPNVAKIVFVLTINEAFEKRLNFSMLKDAYIRILDGSTLAEHISFKMTDYYTNVSSMMIGEIYLHNNTWKFNAVGNGVAKDLEGLCDLYGVQTI